MTIAEIKKEALKLMFTNQDNEIDGSTIEELMGDDNYGDYLANMNGCINRAIVRLKSKGIEYSGERLAVDANNDIELPIDEELSELIPYFIKGELYEEDNPQQASIARNYFEDTVDDYLSTKNQTAVEVVWRLDV
jgi:hypothetical protein